MFERFYFENFAPSEELEAFANLALYNVLDLAPQDSASTAIIERIGEHYTCRIEVVSRSGPFLVSVAANDPRSAVEKGVQKLKEKIDVWKKRRFRSRERVLNSVA